MSFWVKKVVFCEQLRWKVVCEENCGNSYVTINPLEVSVEEGTVMPGSEFFCWNGQVVLRRVRCQLF